MEEEHPFRTFVERVNRLPAPEKLKPAERSNLHPHSTVIHRPVRCVEGADPKAELTKIRSGAEFTRRVSPTSPGDVFVSMDIHKGKQQGISCSTTCHYGPFVRNGNIPLEFLPEGCYSTHEASGTVFIQGAPYQMLRCFHRDVNPAATLTVGEALDQLGDSDECALDDNFVLYFNNSEHGLIRLRHQTRQENGNFTFSSDKQTLTFSDTCFDDDSWVPCDTLFVKIPIPVMTCVLSGIDIEAEKAKWSEEQRAVIDGLLMAFEMTDGDKLEAINASLELLFAAKNLESISTAQRIKIIDILDEFASDIWGDHSGYYLDELRPWLCCRKDNE